MARAHFRRSIFEHLLFGPPLWANSTRKYQFWGPLHLNEIGTCVHISRLWTNLGDNFVLFSRMFNISDLNSYLVTNLPSISKVAQTIVLYSLQVRLLTKQDEDQFTYRQLLQSRFFFNNTTDEWSDKKNYSKSHSGDLSANKFKKAQWTEDLIYLYSQVSLLSHNIQKDIWEKIKDLEETTKNLRNAMGILDPEGAFNSDDFQLNRLDVEISSIRPLPQI